MQKYLEFGLEKVDSDYKSMVDRRFKDINGVEFQNHSIFHSWYIFKKILEYAHNKQQGIVMMSRTLRVDFFNALSQDFKRILESGNSVHLVITDNLESGHKDEDNELVNLLRASPKGKIFIASKQENQSELHRLPPNLLVSQDGECYRLGMDPKSDSAIVAFGNRDLGLKVYAFFNDYMDKNLATNDIAA